MTDAERAELLIRRREERGWSKRAVARAVGVSEAAIRLWENGGGIARRHIPTLASLYDVPVTDLTTEPEAPDTHEIDRLARDSFEQYVARQLVAVNKRLAALNAEVAEQRLILEHMRLITAHKTSPNRPRSTV